MSWPIGTSTSRPTQQSVDRTSAVGFDVAVAPGNYNKNLLRPPI
jgi:hypothetical protein